MLWGNKPVFSTIICFQSLVKCWYKVSMLPCAKLAEQKEVFYKVYQCLLYKRSRFGAVSQDVLRFTFRGRKWISARKYDN